MSIRKRRLWSIGFVCCIVTAGVSAETPNLTRNGNSSISCQTIDIENYISYLEGGLNSVGDDAQLTNTDLQNRLQRQQQTLLMLSNISKLLYDTQMAIIRKIGG